MRRFKKTFLLAACLVWFFTANAPASITLTSTKLESGEGHAYVYRTGMLDSQPTVYSSQALPNLPPTSGGINYATDSNGTKLTVALNGLLGQKGVITEDNLNFSSGNDWHIYKFEVDFVTTEPTTFSFQYDYWGILTATPIPTQTMLMPPQMNLHGPQGEYLITTDHTLTPQTSLVPLPPGAYQFTGSAANDAILPPAPAWRLTGDRFSPARITYPINSLSFVVTPVPEPALSALLTCGSLMLMLLRRARGQNLEG